MKFARKLIIALILAISTVLGIFSWFWVARELQGFDEDVRGDHQLMSATLAGSVARIWRDRGLERGLALIREADRLRADIRLRWVWVEPQDREPTPLAGRDRVRALHPGGTLHVTSLLRTAGPELVADSGGEPWLLTYHAVAAPSGRIGAIEMAESLARRQIRFRSALATVGVTAASLLLICSSLVLFLGVWFVGRPVAKLAQKAQRVGAGDLSEPLILKQRDEIGHLATEMNAMCQRLAEAHSRLEAETQARIAALEQLRHADRLKAVGQLSAGMAHEFGTPLNIVLGRAKMIAQGKATGARLQDYALMISEQAERMTRLIRQLLDYARAREPKTTLHDLSQLAHQTRELILPLAEKRGVELMIDAPDPIFVLVDAVQLQQAMTNVIVNAIHASPPGRAVRVSTGKQRAESPNEPGEPRERAFVRIRDEGEGIAPEIMQRIFEPFFTTKPVGEGAGLGLAVTQGIIREHRGWIIGESELNRGSTFTIYLPVTNSEAAD